MAGYIGTTPVPQATQHRESFTATGGQTSFATAGYTPQFIDVYLNGVKLAPADYTATNGSDVVLASGATASDILEIVAYTPFEVANQTFTGDTSVTNLAVTGTFTSRGIDDNADAVAITIDSSERVGIGTTTVSDPLHIAATDPAIRFEDTSSGITGYSRIFTDNNNAMTFDIDAGNNRGLSAAIFKVDGSEAMRIDSSGHVLIGKAVSDNTTVGVNIEDNGFMSISRSGNIAVIFDRQTTDGDIARFTKDGATVGSIGVEGGDLVIGTGTNCGLQFNDGNTAIRPFNMASNAPVDNAVDLGISSTRFKDLYLSGGVYLGGTGAANKLDDYEEGTFTPTFTSSSGTLSVGYSSQVGRYTKIGRMVHVTVDIQASGAQSGGSGIVRVSGFPFNFKNGPTLHAGAVAFSNNWVSSEAPSHISGEGNTGFATLRRFDGNSEVNDSVGVGAIQTNSRVYFQITYEADGG